MRDHELRRRVDKLEDLLTRKCNWCDSRVPSEKIIDSCANAVKLAAEIIAKEKEAKNERDQSAEVDPDPDDHK